VNALRALVLAASLVIIAGCGSSDGKGSRVVAVKRHLGPLQDARVTCKERDCSVVANMHLSSIYSATLVAAPVIDGVLGDPELEDLEAISVTLDDAAKQQVFSLRCETVKLTRPVTVDTLRKGCHSIFT
jgi:hypothetical protein